VHLDDFVTRVYRHMKAQCRTL